MPCVLSRRRVRTFAALCTAAAGACRGDGPTASTPTTSVTFAGRPWWPRSRLARRRLAGCAWPCAPTAAPRLSACSARVALARVPAGVDDAGARPRRVRGALAWEAGAP